LDILNAKVIRVCALLRRNFIEFFVMQPHHPRDNGGWEHMDGGVVRSWLTIEYQNGGAAIKHLGNSSYKPFPYIMEKN
jgi:hypothetical protein